MINKIGKFLVCIGCLLILSAACLVSYNYIDNRRAEKSTALTVEKLHKIVPILKNSVQTDSEISSEHTEYYENKIIPVYILNPDMEMPGVNIDGWDYIGILEIPSFDIKLPVISECSSASLKIAPCRYSGSVYTDDLVIAAHNYKSHFSELKDLTSGEQITFTDVDGNVFTYEVAMLETLSPSEIEEMIGGKWDLTLFTCTVGGSHRVTVRCESLTG